MNCTTRQPCKEAKVPIGAKIQMSMLHSHGACQAGATHLHSHLMLVQVRILSDGRSFPFQSFYYYYYFIPIFMISLFI